MDQKQRQFIHDNLEVLIEGTTNINSVLSKLLEKGVFQDYMVDMIEVNILHNNLCFSMFH